MAEKTYEDLLQEAADAEARAIDARAESVRAHAADREAQERATEAWNRLREHQDKQVSELMAQSAGGAK